MADVALESAIVPSKSMVIDLNGFNILAPENSRIIGMVTSTQGTSYTLTIKDTSESALEGIVIKSGTLAEYGYDPATHTVTFDIDGSSYGMLTAGALIGNGKVTGNGGLINFYESGANTFVEVRNIILANSG